MADKKVCFTYEIVREGEDRTLRIDCETCSFQPNIEDSNVCMGKTVDLLSQLTGITKIVLVQKRDYEYDYYQTQILNDIAQLYKHLSKESRLSYTNVVSSNGCDRYIRSAYSALQYTIFTVLKGDPVAAYIQLKRLLRNEKIKQEYLNDKQGYRCSEHVVNTINWVLGSLEKTKIIVLSKPYLTGYRIGNREAYRKLFHPSIKPDFMFTKLMASYPSEGTVLDNYALGNTEVTIFGFPDSTKTLYHVVPPEFKFSEEKYELLDTARKIMAEHKPDKAEFVDPERMREVFYSVGRDLIEDLMRYRNLQLSNAERDELAQVLLRYTVGFGLIEILLGDEKIQDVSINSPMGVTPIFIVHQDYDDCDTNITPTMAEAESWATKLRLISGRPLDEANPILDTELRILGISSRVAAVTQPLNPSGIAFSFRRHRDKPWTIPLFMKAKMINSIAGGLFSFLIDGTRTMLIAGTRSSGKTSLLGSVLVEVMPRYRIITIEDTLELPSDSLRKLGYNIQTLKVASALAGKDSAEVDATRGIRSTLRLGDSALIIGEVRSQEAIALYEAMRVGASANIVAGTIHAASPYGVYDRVVNDIGVPKTSFKATDIIIVANPIKTAAGLHKQRRVLQVTEVRKKWDTDPLREDGFVDLLKYNPLTDQLEVTDELMNGNSEVLKEVASNVKEFAGSWDAVWDNVQLRAQSKQALVDISKKSKRDELLEAKFITRSNDMFHKIIERVKDESGELDSKRILFEFQEWLKREAKR
jgi:archaeal flagellar protein FlaI